jgi:hypothetical protein
MTDQKEGYFITWTAEMLVRFKAAYEKAVAESEDIVNDVFMFEDNIYVISYAKYLIQYLDMVVPKCLSSL